MYISQPQFRTDGQTRTGMGFPDRLEVRCHIHLGDAGEFSPDDVIRTRPVMILSHLPPANWATSAYIATFGLSRSQLPDASSQRQGH